jgi:signal transduction histidine kinase/DNA-binding response OmpR family regulator/CHASE3 domain sensor protein
MNMAARPSLLRNLQIGFGLSLFILVITSIASFSSIRNLVDASGWVDHTDSVINQTNAALSAIQDAETGQRGYLLTGDTGYLRPYIGTEERALSTIDRIGAMTSDNSSQQANVRELRQVTIQEMEVLRRMVDGKRSTSFYSLQDMNKGRDLMSEIRMTVQRMHDEEHRLLDQRLARVKKFSLYTPILIVIASLLSILITLFFYRRVANDYKERQSLYAELQSKDEDISRRIDIIQGIAEQVSGGNYGVRVTDEQSDGLGSLAGSLNKMAESLDYSFRLLSDKEWLQTGIARLNEVMIGRTDMGDMVSEIIRFVAEYSRSRIGAFYVLDTAFHYLRLEGSYALPATLAPGHLKEGEGLAGQVALDGKRTIIRHIPADGWVVSLSAGDLKPRTIIAFPFFHDRVVKGVIELGSLEDYSERELEFFTAIADNIGMAVHSIETRHKLQELLEETQAQAEELQSQHGELESLNMELEVQAERLQVSEEELKVQQEELQQANQELEERSRTLEEKNHLILMRNLDIQKKAEELAQTTKYKSEFMANMSHELRTPLNSILLLSRLLAENSGQNLSDEQIEYARVIQNSGHGLLELIDEILDLSRIESGKLQLEFTIVSIASIVEDMRMLFVPLARDKNLEVSFQVEEGTPAQLETDKMRLEQILKNLLSNAFKFTSKGSVTLRIAGSDVSRNFVEFSVKDTGIGIPEDKHRLIFEAFQQADGSTRRKYGGTGLGLSISRELAKLLGGEIVLSSQPGEGSEFIVSIPQFRMEGIVGSEADGSKAPAAVSQVSGGSKAGSRLESKAASNGDVPLFTLSDIPPEIPDDRDNIDAGDRTLLIVEDDTVFAKALLDFTRKKGYRGIVIVRGDVVLGMAKVYKPMGILLDIQLPVKSGWEVMEELKKDPQTRHIPVHIMSSFEVKNESLQKGAVDFVAKPLAADRMENIFEKIDHVLDRGARKVLIVEDNARHAQALAYFLSTHEVGTEISQTVTDSIATLKNAGVDCVILSRDREDTDAGETLEKVRQNSGLEDIPIIVFTGKSISKGEEVRMRQYADSIVVKTAHSYQRILDEVSLFLHLVDEGRKKEAAPKALSRLGALEEVLKNKTVLVADDDVRNIFSFTKALETHKMRVFSAMDGKEALAVVENPDISIDIILMDMMMPEMDGFEAISRIRKNPRMKRVPIIAVTAKAMAGDREKCIRAGASDYISKPVDIDQLLSLLRIWLYEK